ncbi:MAG: flagellar hook-basal body complex protein FliE [Devosia sp.]|nr:flagellar hook-basal body complex protein FliE [Devosia sp.]
MSIPFSAATAAYNNAQKFIDQGVKSATDVADTGSQGIDFAKLVSDAVQGVVEAGRASDHKSLDLVNGRGNLVDVVTSVAQTQVAVEGLVAVRDRVISAYEDIMKMSI